MHAYLFLMYNQNFSKIFYLLFSILSSIAVDMFKLIGYHVVTLYWVLYTILSTFSVDFVLWNPALDHIIIFESIHIRLFCTDHRCSTLLLCIHFKG